MSAKAEKLTANKLTPDRTPEEHKVFVGQGVVAREVVLVADSITVEGVLEGDIAVTSLFVNRTGTIRGRISVAKNAEIFGTVLERLDVKGDLVLRSGSCVAGTVSYGRLSIDQGANLIGEISAPDQRAAPAQQPSQTERKAEPRAGNGVAPPNRIDLSVLELMPGPIAATS